MVQASPYRPSACLCITCQLPQEHHGCESQLCCPALDVVARMRFQPRPDSGQFLVALSLAVAPAEEEACSAFPRHWPNCCFLLSVGSSPGPSSVHLSCLSTGSPFVPLERKVGRQCPVPFHALHSAHPFPPLSLGHTALSSSHALLQDHSLVSDSLSSTRP